VTRKFEELTIEEFNTRKTPIKPKSTLPIAVYLTRLEKGVIIAHPGSTSLAFFSTDHTKDSSLPKRLYRVFWCLEAKRRHRHASRVNLK
jgi:hypothetical protein